MSVELAKKAIPMPKESYFPDEAKFRAALKADQRSSEYLEEALLTFQDFDRKLYQFVEGHF